MKITCQSCQAKYTIADEKIHGKVAKIRCRKCGETIEVDGTALGAPPAEPPAEVATAPGGESMWTVNLADDDQRAMTLGEILEGYRAGYITAETYLWADGMADWSPLAEVPEVVAALGSDLPVADDEAEPVRDSMFHEPAYGQAAAVAGSHERADLFGGSAEDEVSLPASSDSPTATPQPLGARDEQSVLFSLSALTASAPKISVPPSSTGPTDDSGLIDLNALAAQAQAPEAAKAGADEPAPFLFPAALGSVEPVTKPATPEAAAAPASSSKAPLFIGAGIAVAGVAIALVLASRPAEPPAPAAPSVTAAAAPAPVETAPPPAATAAPEPAPVASAVAPEPEAEAVKEAAVKKPAAPKPAKPAAPKPAKPAAPANAGAPKPAAAPKKSSNCGCAPSDLQCQIRCSATGK